MELFLRECKKVDIVITTANIPGRRAPVLLKSILYYLNNVIFIL